MNLFRLLSLFFFPHSILGDNMFGYFDNNFCFTFFIKKYKKVYT